MKKYFKNLRFTQCLSIPVREFWSVQTWRSSCDVINACVCVVWYVSLFSILRQNALCAHDITYAGHYEKSLLRDNDSCCYLHKMKISSSDWIALSQVINSMLTARVGSNVRVMVTVCQFGKDYSQGQWLCFKVLRYYWEPKAGKKTSWQREQPSLFRLEIPFSLWYITLSVGKKSLKNEWKWDNPWNLQPTMSLRYQVT